VKSSAGRAARPDDTVGSARARQGQVRERREGQARVASVASIE
jgi:hypothetical protein